MGRDSEMIWTTVCYGVSTGDTEDYGIGDIVSGFIGEVTQDSNGSLLLNGEPVFQPNHGKVTYLGFDKNDD